MSMLTMNPVGARLSAPLGVAATAAVGCLVLGLANPSDDGTPLCPTKALTGLDCPFCGGMRSVSQLVRGHPGMAADHNLVVVAAFPVAVVWWALWTRAARRGSPPPRLSQRASTRWVVTSIVVALTAFTIVRNLPIAGLPHWLASGAA